MQSIELRTNEIESGLLCLTYDFLFELKSEITLPELTLTASLSRELGIDSLGKAELAYRIEEFFSVEANKIELSNIDKLADFIPTILEISDSEKFKAQEKLSPSFLSTSLQDLAVLTNFSQILTYHGERSANRPHLYIANKQQTTDILRYGQLFIDSQKIAKNLVALKIKPQQSIAILFATQQDFIRSFCGIILAGAIPILLESEESIIQTKFDLVITSKISDEINKKINSITSTKNIITLNNLLQDTCLELPNLIIKPEDIAFIKYKKNEFGYSEKNTYTHTALLEKLRQIGKWLNIKPTDNALSAIPPEQTAGLNLWLLGLYFGLPITFIAEKNPVRWLWAIHYRRATVAVAPDYFYAKCIKKMGHRKTEGLDLHSWRFAFGEHSVIERELLKKFDKKFTRYNFHAKTSAILTKSIINPPAPKKILTKLANNIGHYLLVAYRKIHEFTDHLFKFFYTFYAWAMFFILLPFYLLSVILSPINKARKVSSFWLRNYFRLIFCPIKINGLENIPKSSKVIFVANHTSYADAPLLMGVLPENVIFTVRKESFTTPIIGKVIKKFGHLIIDRQNFTESLASSKRMEKHLINGEPMVVFPEATFDYATGLRPFKMGAFVVAAATGTPVCPVSIKGTRSLWRCYTWLAKPAMINVTIGKPIYPQQNDWQEALKLHQQTRTEILKHCGEPIIHVIAAGPEGLPVRVR